MLTLVLRILFVGLAFAMGLGIREAVGGEPPILPGYFPYLVAGLAACVVTVEKVFQKRYLRSMVAVFAGLVLGLFITIVFSLLFILLLPAGEDTAMRTLVDEFVHRLKVVSPFIPVAARFICYMTITIVMQTRDQFRFIFPYVDLSHRGRPSGGLLLDTSALIDGRIVEMAVSGLTESPITVSSFVIRELQAVADSSEKAKRGRGRRGLDMLKRLRDALGTEVRISEAEMESIPEGDEKLVHLARGLDAKLVTTDGNLARIARIGNIAVIHIHELMRELRPPAIAGEEITVRVTRPGAEPGQGVGHLEDGTMVVVEGARENVGETVDLVVTSSIQTSAGRMSFGRFRDAAARGGK